MNKVLIVNAVPTNNGDAALVLGLRKKLVESGFEVIISTVNYKTVKKLYPEVKWVKSEYDLNRVEKKILRKFPKFKKKLYEYRIKNNKEFKDVDIIISAPGGYINSYYGIEDKLFCMDILKKNYNTKLIMYSQSVGPLNSKDRDILDKYMKIFDLFMVRDEISYKNVKQYNNVLKTNDAAFLLDTIKGNCTNKRNKMAISVREWSYDGRNGKKYKNLIKNIVKKCIDNGYDVEFISTCQGLKNYIDDSKIAKEIKNEIEERYKNHIEVNDNYYTLYDLRNYISNFDFVIGTRLHMCILSILSGVPAFNISYEVKGKECYKILNLDKYSIDYNDEVISSMEKIQNFIDNNKDLKEIYKEKAEAMHIQAVNHFKYMLYNIIKE